MSPSLPALEAPAELVAALQPLLPRLAGQGVERLVVFSYSRPGEPQFWMAYLFVEGKRHSLGTPDLLALPLEGQAPDLVRQLKEFVPRSTLLADTLFDIPDVSAPDG
jgi:hypothetical protein